MFKKTKLFYSSLEILQSQGHKIKSARALLAKLFHQVGDTEGMGVLIQAADKVDMAAYIGACISKIHLPTDNQDLWKLRTALGLKYTYDDLADCHEEIKAHLREHPDDRAKVSGYLDHGKRLAAGMVR